MRCGIFYGSLCVYVCMESCKSWAQCCVCLPCVMLGGVLRIEVELLDVAGFLPCFQLLCPSLAVFVVF